MPGDSFGFTETTSEHGTGGLPLCVIAVNGGHRLGVDDCALFRLTDTGLRCYQERPDLRAGIMCIKIDGEPAVKEISRHPDMEKALLAWRSLSTEEQERTLIRSVSRPA